jgi:hypothetical protein
MRINRKKWDSISFQDIYLTFLLNFRNEKEIRKKRMRKTRVYMQKPTNQFLLLSWNSQLLTSKTKNNKKKGVFPRNYMGV